MIEPIVDIDINNIFYELHLVAKKECNDAEIAVYNTAVDEENKTFVGAGEFYIIAYSKKPDDLGASSIDKNKALGEIKKYISSFCGKESADVISDADMQPIKNEQAVNQQSPTGENKVNEAISYDYSLLANLFGDFGDDVLFNEEDGDSSEDSEDEEEDGSEDASSSSKPKDAEGAKDLSKDSKKISEEPSKDEDEKPVVGYMVPFTVKIAGQKVQPAKKTLGRFMDHVKSLGYEAFFTGIPSLVSKTANAIGGLKIGSDSMSINTNVVNKAVAKGTEAAFKAAKNFKDRRSDFEVETFVQALRSEFDSDYRNNTAQIFIDTRSNIETRLKQQKKTNSKINDKLKNGTDSVVNIIVKSSDTNYPKYNKGNIIKTIDKAVLDIDKRKKFTKDNVIKIGGYSTKTTKVQSKNTLTFESIQLEQSIMSILFEDEKTPKTTEEYCNALADMIFSIEDKPSFWKRFLSDASLSDKDVKVEKDNSDGEKSQKKDSKSDESGEKKTN